ncbi:hypothetical protein B0H19DRAFT_1197065 [Mycena capillaripes]|nr:hypothetical protein B0H19DRAFT_1197065 [Mycena capillaripes]
MSSSASETDPLLPRATPALRKANFLWLVPVVAFASICRGISMFGRYEHYQRTFCPGAAYTCGYFTPWLELPSITVQMQIWGTGMFASFMVSFISVGWWSELGDREGRKIVLLFSILGTVAVDVIYLFVANISPSKDDAQDLMSIGLIIEGLLGGFATYNGVVHAYAFDVAPTPLSRPIFFGLVDALSLVGFIIGAIIGKFAGYTVAYVFSVVIALGNLAFIYKFLPESFKQPDGSRAVTPQRSIVKSIVSPFSVFFRGANSSQYLPLFALGFYFYSLTTAGDTYLLKFTVLGPFWPGLPRWLVLIGGRVLSLTTLLCIIPGIAWLFERKFGATERAGLQLATKLAQNSILIAAISCSGVIVFCLPDHSRILYALFASVYPIATAASVPALYALGTAYFVALGRASEIGSLYGALAIWSALAQYLSYSWYSGKSEMFWLSASFLVIALVPLLPDPPPVQDEEVSTATVQDV